MACIEGLTNIEKIFRWFCIWHKRYNRKKNSMRKSGYIVDRPFDYSNQFNETGYDISVGSRLVQICSPNITYPTVINIVNNDSELDIPKTSNARGTGGFGSTGY